MNGLLLWRAPAGAISITLHPNATGLSPEKRENLLIATAIVCDRGAVIEHNRIHFRSS
jgi:hypothetical protein